MRRHIYTCLISCFALLLNGCGIYNFSGASTGTATSFQVNFFPNYADQSPGSTIEPQLDRDFTNALQDLITNLTSLSLTGSNGDLVYEGEIVEYRVSPMSATADQTAAQNRLTMSVNVRFYNKTKEDSDFEQRFSFFYDFPDTQLLESVKAEAHEVLFERITQDIFNASLADW
ncbi:LptE family protein [uncultured Croceitalea sp.]|uniref:LptE family protein n=1 Tax=uncultured Croceitalea sp. TaxID=1798908 RepID=UPI0033057D62